jgi:hypothetical protein
MTQPLGATLIDFSIGVVVGLLIALFVASVMSLVSHSVKQKLDASTALIWAAMILFPLFGPLAWFRSRRQPRRRRAHRERSVPQREAGSEPQAEPDAVPAEVPQPVSWDGSTPLHADETVDAEADPRFNYRTTQQLPLEQHAQPLRTQQERKPVIPWP